MTGRRAIVGLCMLCALAFSAFAVQSASAATKGLTLFTCKEPGVGETGVGTPFNKAHCKDADTDVNGKFRHVEVPQDTTTQITGTTVDTEGKPTTSRLKATLSGVETELVSHLAHLHPEVGTAPEPWITNAKDPTTGEHYFHGETNVLYTEVTVDKPVEKGCKVKGGQITTKRLKFSSKGLTEETVKFEPAEGTVFAEFEVESCTVAALNGKYTVTGSVKGVVDGATLNFTHATTTAQNTLFVRGAKAGFDSSVTVKGTDKAKGDVTDTPLSATTVETP